MFEDRDQRNAKPRLPLSPSRTVDHEALYVEVSGTEGKSTSTHSAAINTRHRSKSAIWWENSRLAAPQQNHSILQYFLVECYVIN